LVDHAAVRGIDEVVNGAESSQAGSAEKKRGHRA